MDVQAKILQISKSSALYAFFFLIIFLKLVVFAYYEFGTILVSSLWNTPLTFWSYYLPKIAAALSLTSLLYIIKDKRWSVLILCILDLWMLANLLYMRSYAMALDAYAVSMVGNLKGFWGSVWPLFRLADLVLVGLTIIWTFFVFSLQFQYQRKFKTFIVLAVIAYILNFSGQYTSLLVVGGHNWAINHVHMQCLKQRHRFDVYGSSAIETLRSTSPVHTFWYTLYDLYVIHMVAESYSLDSEERDVAMSLMNENVQNANRKLIIVLVESFDNWVLTEQYMPNWYRYIHSRPIFYANHIKSQVRGGMSADGQMIINTGLLPITEGAACFRFPMNAYPGIMKHINGKTITILPHKKDVWNQATMATAYGYEEILEELSGNDSILFEKVIKCAHNGYSGIQMLTLSTHTPYDYTSKHSALVLPDTINDLVAAYIRSFNVFDERSKHFLQALESDTILSQYTIVVTGDHKAPIGTWYQDATCPLIIRSPYIPVNYNYIDTCYQMDVYPTLQGLLGVNFEWTGLGIDLMSQDLVRKFEEEYTFVLSDKLIKSDFFKREE